MDEDISGFICTCEEVFTRPSMLNNVNGGGKNVKIGIGAEMFLLNLLVIMDFIHPFYR